MQSAVVVTARIPQIETAQNSPKNLTLTKPGSTSFVGVCSFLIMVVLGSFHSFFLVEFAYKIFLVAPIDDFLIVIIFTMAPPRTARLDNGKFVCHDHGLSSCYKCRVNVSLMNHEDEERLPSDGYISNVDDIGLSIRSHCSSHDCPCYMCPAKRLQRLNEGASQSYHWEGFGECARFVPQHDKELPSLQFDPIPACQRLPFASVGQFYCSYCQLTWLADDSSAEVEDCPNHHSIAPRSYDHNLMSQSRRTLIIFTDGACPGNGSPQAYSGIGVSFHASSSFNLSEPMLLPEHEFHTSQKAELWAVIRALQTIRTEIAPTRSEHIHYAGAHCNCGCCRAIYRFRTVIVTDSSYVVELICSHLPKWTWSEARGVYYNKHKQVRANSDLIRCLVDEMYTLFLIDIKVVFCHVLRHENKHANDLAQGWG